MPLSQSPTLTKYVEIRENANYTIEKNRKLIKWCIRNVDELIIMTQYLTDFNSEVLVSVTY